MKALVISPYIPHTSTGGSGLKLLSTLQCLSEKYEITLITFYSNRKELDILQNETLKIVSEILPVNKNIKFSKFKYVFFRKYDFIKRFWSNYINSFLKNNAAQYNIIYLDSIFNAQYIDNFVHNNIVVDFHNFHSEIIEENLVYEKSNIKKKILIREFEKVKKFETEILKNMRLKKIITGNIPESLKNNAFKFIKLIPVPDLKFNFEETRETILFTGNFSWIPNILAVDDFIETAQKNMDKKFIIAGKNLNKIKKKFPENIELKTDFKNHPELFSKSGAFFCPVKKGSGINMKLIEALSAGMHIFTTEESVKKIPEIENHVTVCRNITESTEKIKNFKFNTDISKQNTDFISKLKKSEREKFLSFI